MESQDAAILIQPKLDSTLDVDDDEKTRKRWKQVFQV